MTILTNADRTIVKRTVPKTSAQIIDATVARLYVSTDSDNWSWSGLMGALVFIDDLIGHTFWFKLIDIKTGNVLWDHELWTDFNYSQDRVFFHSFESNDYQIGFLFEDKSDAQHFFKRVSNRAKYASKATVANNNAIEIRKKPSDEPATGFRGQNNVNTTNDQRSRRAKGVLYYDDLPPPEWRSFYSQLEQMGITEDMIAENREFIKDYISKQGGPLVGLEPPIPRRFQHAQHAQHTPAPAAESKSRQRSETVSSSNSNSRSKKAPPPPPPAPTPPSEVNESQQLHTEEVTVTATAHEMTSPTRHSVPPAPVFNVPPAFNPQNQPGMSQGLPNRTAVAPPPGLPLRGGPPPVLPQRGSAPPPPPSRNGITPAPPPSRRPIPPPPGGNAATPPPPPPPRRGNVPPPPPSRTMVPIPPARELPISPVPPPNMPPRMEQAIPQPPPLQQQQLPSQPPTSFQQQAIPQPPPLLPPQQSNIPPPPPMNNSIPPPPPMMPNMNSAGPPPPPAPGPPPQFNNNAPTPAQPPAAAGGRDALLASIRSSGLGSLRSVDKSQLDKPSVLLQEARGEPVSTTSHNAPSGSQPPGGNLADALQAALNNRKKKVAESDDESDSGW